MICEGYNVDKKLEKSDKLEPESGTPSPPESANKGFKSDHIVSRMKLFFQGRDPQPPQRSQSPQPQRRYSKLFYHWRAQNETKDSISKVGLTLEDLCETMGRRALERGIFELGYNKFLCLKFCTHSVVF